MIPNQKLSKNFSLHELLMTEHRQFDEEQFNPSPEIVANLKALCVNVLQPLRDALGYPLKINSGYRCPALNKAIGGAKNSQHMLGQAADIIDLTNGNEKLFKKIKALKLPFDQMIDEFGFRWVHVSYDIKRQRGQILQAVRDAKGKTVYIQPKL
ncbi:MAG: D-Ala-D-Ala carboxypeptidase family metallohydrolase [Bacteroidia bacterium]|jgi:zinc D-Ala-D-Ala carboxypeptidase